MLTLTEDDSRRQSNKRNSNRERATVRRRAAWSFVGAVLIAAGFAACGTESITAPRAPQAPAHKFVAGQPQASIGVADPSVMEFPEVANETPFVVDNPCTREPVEGTLRRRDRFTFNSNTVHLSVHTKMRFDGEGLPRPDGTKVLYNGNGEDMFQMNVTETNGEQTHITTIIINAKNAVTGERGDDFRMHITEHITFKPPGPPRATVNNIRTECN
jgi:hypothetical protein